MSTGNKICSQGLIADLGSILYLGGYFLVILATPCGCLPCSSTPCTGAWAVSQSCLKQPVDVIMVETDGVGKKEPSPCGTGEGSEDQICQIWT